jgi:hypothetical protein
MKIAKNVLNTNLLYATYRYNNIMNSIYYDYYKVAFGSKGRVKSRNHRDLEFICLIAMEEILAKRINHNGEYSYIVVEMGQEEGLACMTIPKTTSRLYHAVLKCMYNSLCFCYNYVNYWWPHPSLNRIIIS